MPGDECITGRDMPVDTFLKFPISCFSIFKKTRQQFFHSRGEVAGMLTSQSHKVFVQRHVD